MIKEQKELNKPVVRKFEEEWEEFEEEEFEEWEEE